jgi:Bromodomain
MNIKKSFKSYTGLSLDKAKDLIEYLEAQPESFDFLLPVDCSKNGYPDYPKIIKHPMDLGTIKKLLRDGQYCEFSEVLADLDLIWDNCKKYNQAGSVIYK